MLHKLKPIPRFLVILAIVGAAGYALTNIPAVSNYLKPKTAVVASVPDKIDLPTAAPAVQSAGTTIVAPAVNGGKLRVKTIPWNAGSGLHFAKAGGLFKAKGLDVTTVKEDDYAKLIADMAAFAKDNNTGSHFVVIMGDGYPAFAIGANEALKPYGQKVKMIAGIGYSRGEDKCIVADGVDLKGAVIAGYLGDGDINICIKKAADMGILVNSDPKIYNPNAVNFVGTGSFVEADDKFIASLKQGLKGSCEDRTHSETGKKVNVCVNGTATWTPGDSKVFFEAKKLGMSIKVIASTKEYLWQMPTAVIGNDAWMKAHRAETKAFLAAIFEGGERVRSDRAALTVAGAEQAAVYGEQDTAYWVSMFNGVTEVGPNGKPIELGGSTTNGLADAARLFGLNGADNLYKQVYTVYGKIAVKYFPDIMPGGLLPYDDVVDSSYVNELVQATGNVGQAALPKYGTTTETFAARTVSVEFETGKATFTPAATKALNDILDQTAVTGLSVQINGHTDAKGNPQANIELSKARAEAVKQFLMTNAPTSFPAERVATRGFGSSMPVGTDAQNRRVEIILRK